MPGALLKNPDYVQILPLCANQQDCNALQTLLDHPSRHLWITFQDDCLWWCLVEDGVTVYDDKSEDHGHFSLQCKQGYGWSNRSLLNKDAGNFRFARSGNERRRFPGNRVSAGLRPIRGHGTDSPHNPW